MTTRILVVGNGVLAESVCNALEMEHGFHIARHSNLSSSVPSDIDLALVLDDGWHPADYVTAERTFRSARRPWLRAYVLFGDGFIGPLVRPGHAGCTQCADARILMAESERRELAQIRTQMGGARTGVDHDAFASRSGLLQMADIIVAEVKRFTADASSCSLVHDVICTHLQTLETTRHFILPNAECPFCGTLPEDGPDEVTIALEPTPKLSEDSFRSQSIEDIGETLLHDYLDARTGLMNEKMYDLITPFAAVSVNLPLMMGDEGTSGRAHAFKECEWTAILEGLERFCGLEPRGKRTVICDSYNNLQQHALNPAAVGLHDEHQYTRPDFPFQAFDGDAAANWVWAYSLTYRHPILVPERLAYYSLGFDGGFVYETSNGCALGSTLVEAVFHGILEIVERDAFLMTWYAQLPLPAVDMTAVNDTELQWMIQRIRSVAGYDLHFYNATMENGIPAVFIVAKNRRTSGLNLLCSAGAHVDPMRAVKGAIQETAGMLLRFDEKLEAQRERYLQMLQDSNLVQHMDEHSMLYGLPEAEGRLDFLLKGSRSVQTFEEAFHRDATHLDLKDDLQDLLDIFASLRLEVIVVNQTAPELARNGLHCVKVLIPGMLPMTFGHRLRRVDGLNRVLHVPMKLGYSDRSLTMAELNPYPHPFP